MSGRSGRSETVRKITTDEVSYLESMGIPLPPSLAPKKPVQQEALPKRMHRDVAPLGNHIPGDCPVRTSKMQRSIPEFHSAPVGMIYASRSKDEFVGNVINWQTIAPKVCNLTTAWKAVGVACFYSPSYRVYYNSTASIVEAVVSVGDKEAIRFYDAYYYSSQNSMMKIMNGSAFKEYVDNLVTMMNGSDPVITLSKEDMAHYIKTVMVLPFKPSFTKQVSIGYAGVNNREQPSHIDYARVRAITISLGDKPFK